MAEVYESDDFLGHTSNKNFVWSPDSKYIAYVSATEKPVSNKDKIKVYSRILYKTRTAFSDNIKTHIYIVPAEGGEAKQITTGRYDEHTID